MAHAMMPDDRRSLSIRLTSFQYIVAVLFSVLAVAFWFFQVVQHQKFKEMAEENHIRVIPMSAGSDTHLSTGFSPGGSAGGRDSDKESSGTTSGSGFPRAFPLGAEAPRG